MAWDIDKIKLNLAPKGVCGRSKLASRLKDIEELKRYGYTLTQIRELLAQDGVEISLPGLSSYLKRHSRLEADSKLITEEDDKDKKCESLKKSSQMKDPIALRKIINSDVDIDDYMNN